MITDRLDTLARLFDAKAYSYETDCDFLPDHQAKVASRARSSTWREAAQMVRSLSKALTETAG